MSQDAEMMGANICRLIRIFFPLLESCCWR